MNLKCPHCSMYLMEEILRLIEHKLKDDFYKNSKMPDCVEKNTKTKYIEELVQLINSTKENSSIKLKKG